MENKPGNFPGTYFEKDTVLKLASVAKVFSWIIVVFYGIQWLVQLVTTLLQLSQGLWAGLGVPYIIQNILGLFEQPLRGLVYFIVLQGVAQALLMFMDMEDNTRRTAHATRGK